MAKFKPTNHWLTDGFEDHRRFNPRATITYDFMMIKPSYDPKMEKLFDTAQEDIFHDLRVLDINRL